MNYIRPEERNEVEALAVDLNTEIPYSISVLLIWLPFIKALLARIEALEAQVKILQSRGDN